MILQIDPRVEKYWIMRSYFPITLIIGGYLIFVLKLGPALMRSRRPYQIKGVLIIYNISQVVFNFALFIESTKILPHLNVLCSPSDRSLTPFAAEVLNLHHSYTCLKLFDFLDTVFFVLRKSAHQITFLHVYHHVGILMATWVGEKYAPGGHGVFVIAFNCFVHSVMYVYYLMSVLKPAYVKKSWWKKYLTLLQIVQHYTVLTLFLLQLFNPKCTYPKFLSSLFIIGTVVLIYHFTIFYKKSYGEKQKNRE